MTKNVWYMETIHGNVDTMDGWLDNYNDDELAERELSRDEALAEDIASGGLVEIKFVALGLNELGGGFDNQGHFWLGEFADAQKARSKMKEFIGDYPSSRRGWVYILPANEITDEYQVEDLKQWPKY